MIDETALAQKIRNGIKEGSLPSDVFRALLREETGLEKYTIGSLLQDSFPQVDGDVWNILAHWKPELSSDYWDTRMNISLINEILKSGEKLSWDRQYLEEEWSRIGGSNPK